MLNKRGVIVEGATLAIVGVGLVIAAIALTPSHRERRAMEKCLATEPAGTDCTLFVSQVKASGGLSGAKPSYIRDI